MPDRPVPEGLDALALTIRCGLHIHPDEPGDIVVDLRLRALAALDALVVRCEKAEAERDQYRREWEAYARQALRAEARAEDAEAENARLRQTLVKISEAQLRTLRMIESNGFVFTDIGREPGNWQHLAFSIYADLCEVDALARAALDEEAEA